MCQCLFILKSLESHSRLLILFILFILCGKNTFCSAFYERVKIEKRALILFRVDFLSFYPPSLFPVDEYALTC